MKEINYCSQTKEGQSGGKKPLKGGEARGSAEFASMGFRGTEEGKETTTLQKRHWGVSGAQNKTRRRELYSRGKKGRGELPLTKWREAFGGILNYQQIHTFRSLYKQKKRIKEKDIRLTGQV